MESGSQIVIINMRSHVPMDGRRRFLPGAGEGVLDYGET